MNFDFLIFIVTITIIAVFVVVSVIKAHLVGVRFRQSKEEAKKLERQNRHMEAYKAYEAILRQTPEWLKDDRVKTMFKLALTASNSGQPEHSIKWAERIIALRPAPHYEILAHNRAGGGLMTLNRLDEAYPHFLAERKLAIQAGKRNQAAQAIGQIALLEMKRGRFEEADKLARQAIDEAPGRRFVTFAILAACHRKCGRFTEAREALLQARACQTEGAERKALSAEARAYHDRRQQASLALHLAAIESELGRASEAWNYLSEAKEGFAGDQRLLLRCEATESWVLAILGQRDKALNKMDQVEAAANQVGANRERIEAAVWPPSPSSVQDREIEQDREPLRNVYSLLGKAALSLGQYERAKKIWEKYSAMSLPPDEETAAYYFLGECCHRLGDEKSAHDLYQRCIGMNIPNYRAKLATERLQEMGAATTPA